MNNSDQPNPTSPITRRTFLKTSSVAVIGGSFLGSLSIERSAHAAATDDTITIALIGCGGRGTGAADQALSTAGNVKLIAMADAFPTRLQSSLGNLSKMHPDRVDVPAERQFTGFDAYKKAIPLADLVILATPPGFRPIHFEEAVNAGKNIFMEKPVAVDGPGVRRVLAAAAISKQKGLRVGVGFQRHHQAGYIETIKRIQDGALGDIHMLRCYWNGNRPWQHPRKPGMTEMEFQMTNWYYFAWLCGDHIVEQHIHNLDVANWVMNGHPIRANGMGGAQKPRTSNDGEIFDHHAVEFEYPGGARLFSQCRHIQGCWDDVSEHVQGSKGKADMFDGRWSIEAGDKWQFPKAAGIPRSPYNVEHDDLFAAIRANRPYNEAEYGAHSTMTAIMGRMATYSGKTIEWEQALNSQVSLAPEKYAWDALPKPTMDASGLYPMPLPGDPEWLKKII